MSEETQLPPGDVPQAEVPTPGADAAPSSTEPAPSEAAPVGAEVPESGEAAAVIPAGNASDAAPQSSAANASQGAGTSPTGASSLGDPMTFEQRVENRFLALEAFLMKIPHSIAYAISQGSAEPEELAHRALTHLFDQDK